MLRPDRSGRRRGLLTVLLLASAFWAGGCMTLDRSTSVLTRDGKSYGTVKGAFHSRWWNFYERGCSFADGAFWPEAEKDLRTALALRRDDQLWPRTYGLHFLPEYFPHRELGAVLYHQGRLDEAVTELETSLGRQFSARAAFLLNEARRKLASERKGDTTAPVLDVPLLDRPVAAAELRIAGTARDDGFVSRVSVNGLPCAVPVYAPSIRFEQNIPLASGVNNVVIEAEDLSGNKVSVTHAIYCDLDGPAVSFDEPVRLPGRVTGAISDTSGVHKLVLGGKPATLSQTADGCCAFSVDCADIEIKAPLSYEVSDDLGNTTRGQVPVGTVALSRHPDGLSLASFTPVVQQLSPTLCGVFEAGVLVGAFRLAAAETASTPLTARFSNVIDGRKYLMEEIAVAVEIEAAEPVAKAFLNGVALPIMPGRTLQRITRRVPLKPGPNVLELSAETQNGGRTSAVVNIERQLSSVEQAAGKLNVAVLGNVWKGNSPQLENEASFIIDAFLGEFSRRDRFNLTDRSLLPEVLTEQKLNALLGSRDERLAVGKLVPAEVMVVGRVRRDADSMEIIAEAISSETSQFVARADVAGPANNLDQLRQLVGDLALRLTQEFPRVQGQVALVRGAEQFITNLNAAQNVRGSMKLVVFRYGQDILDPVSKESLGKDTLVLGDALVEVVDEKKSVAHRASAREQGQTPPDIQVGDYVVVK